MAGLPPAKRPAVLLDQEAAEAEKMLPRVISFVVTPDQRTVIDQAVGLASDGTPGRARKVHGLTNLASGSRGIGMDRQPESLREEGHRLYPTGELHANAAIAARHHVKPNTLGKWRREVDWNGLRMKVDKRAAKMRVETIASEALHLNPDVICQE